ncbi:MAG: 30S ribosomal protein S16 [Gammaproteobacteria bacterium]|nr:30S ribosomal protein S16 [Gammaproteobacteria bacterium]
MVVIRLSRGGSKKRPFYKVVVADRRAARDGKYIEHLGYFNPIAVGGEKRLELDKERVTHWIGQGAQPSDRVKNLLRELDKPEILEKREVKEQAHKAKKKEEAKVKLEEAKAKLEEAEKAAEVKEEVAEPEAEVAAESK